MSTRHSYKLNMLLFTSYISSAADPLCTSLVQMLAQRLNGRIQFINGRWPQRLAALTEGRAHIAWTCGLLHVHQEKTAVWPYIPIAAPVGQPQRYQNQPIYFADLLVHAHSRFHSVADLAGATWAVNERSSLSGYQMLIHWLAQHRLDATFFGDVQLTGSHLNSLAQVAQGTADFATIDSTVCDMLARQDADQLRPFRRLLAVGPFPAPPLLVHRSLPSATKTTISAALSEWHTNANGRFPLRAAAISRFAPVNNRVYDPIRHMRIAQ